MANLGKIVYLSAEQKDTLFANGSVTVGGTTITYSANDLYLTPETGVSSVASVDYDSTNKKITKTVGSSTSDVVSIATLKTDLQLAKGDVGLGNVDNVRQYSASNPPPYPVTSVNGSTGAVTVRELPSVSSSDNDKVLKVVSGAWTAATDSSGGSVNFVTFTVNKNPYSVTADKTFQEVKTGIDNGELWFAIVKGDYFTQSGAYNFPLGSPVVFELNSCSSSIITFSMITAKATASNQTLIHNRVSIQSDGTYGSSVSQMGIAKPTNRYENYLILQTNAEGYPDPPTGTLSLMDGGSVPTFQVLYDALYGYGDEGDKVIRLIYYLGEEDYDIYQLTEAKREYNLDDEPEYTAVFKTLSSRNGTPLIKTVIAHGTSDWYGDAFVGDATVTYSEYTAFLPSVSSSDNDKVLKVVSGAWTAATDSSSDIILVQNAQPQSTNNKIWIKETSASVSIPEMSDIADFVSFTEDQTSRTGVEKAQARDNIGAEPATAWTSYQYVYTLNSQQGSMTIFRKGRLRIANFDSNIKPASANTQYTLFTLNDIDKPSASARFASNTKVNSAMKGYGFYHIETDGSVSYITTYAGNQEGRATGAYLAAE